MSDGNWSKRIALGLALIAFAVLLGFSYHQYRVADADQASIERHADNQAQIEADKARRATSACAQIVVPQSKLDCQQAAQEASENAQREIRDLEAQKIMALWTGYMGLAAIIGTTVGIIGVGLVFVTFAATREGNEIARSTGERQLRAWLQISPSLVEPLERRETWGTYVETVIENIGKTPAFEVHSAVRMHMPGADQPSKQAALEAHIAEEKAKALDSPRVNILPSEKFSRKLPAYIDTSVWNAAWRGSFDNPEKAREKEPLEFFVFITVVILYRTISDPQGQFRVSAYVHDLRWAEDDNEKTKKPFIDNTGSISEQLLMLCPATDAIGIIS